MNRKECYADMERYAVTVRRQHKRYYSNRSDGNHYAWTPLKLALLLYFPGTDTELHRHIGNSVHSIQVKRCELRKQIMKGLVDADTLYTTLHTNTMKTNYLDDLCNYVNKMDRLDVQAVMRSGKCKDTDRYPNTHYHILDAGHLDNKYDVTLYGKVDVEVFCYQKCDTILTAHYDEGLHTWNIVEKDPMSRLSDAVMVANKLRTLLV